MSLLAWALAGIAAGSIAYALLVVAAVRSYRAVRPRRPEVLPPISILKPLAGAEDELERNLRSFFEQEYPAFEILFAVRSANDPAVPVAERLQRQYPHVPTSLLVTGEPPYPNAKVFSLARMLERARYDLVVMSDSDIRVTPGMLRVIAAEFQDARVGLATCPYRAVPGKSLWSVLEALGLNTEFLAGVLAARLVEGMRFAVGPTIVARRSALERIGGLERVKDYLAEDFMLGKLAAEAGVGVRLSSFVVEHHIGGTRFLENLRHRLRWARSTRRSRPAGYVGQVFTQATAAALALWAARPEWWPLAASALLFRGIAAWAVAGGVLRDPLTKRWWWLIPVQDLLSCLIWIAGFFGDRISWRGRQYRLCSDGRFELVGRGPAGV
ncbi:MAG: bacteriohopanetetrol glucosamine biosynthesis glycosyltransferase HpnI [Bryobacterales bacterium]|nr:bacteriohopanetetrol glucosamine biosynthesis glycosyltransferase HpnI [Bryobacterales bacterium]